MPLVSVVVICYNDARHLATAVRSALGQTLRDLEIVVVDDGSTDDTPAVVQALAAEDPRVVPIRLDSNSGGCSRPRNAGLSRATGDYVTFLDSDDVLPRRACARLLRGARRTDADMVCGRVLRRHHHPTRYLASHERLYRRAEFLRSITARPEQLWDTPACAKLYRKSFLEGRRLRFPEGLLYEDLLFTTEAYCTARGIAIVPELVYVWNVRRAADVLSITNSPDLRRWHDRFEVHRRIDDFLVRSAADEALVRAKTRKFLDNDMTLFLRELRARDDGDRLRLLDLVADYTVRLTPQACADSTAAGRVAAVAAARRDLAGLLLVADFAVTGGVGAPLVQEGQRLLWPVDGDTATSVDVTDTGLLGADFASTPFLVTVREADWDATVMRLQGRVADVCGRLGPASELSARLTVTGRVGGPLWTGDAVRLDHSPGGVTFSAQVDLAAVGRRLARPTVGHELRLGLALVRGGARIDRPLTARDADLPIGDHPLATPWRPLVGDKVRVAEVNGRLVLQLTALPRVTAGAIAAGSWGRYVVQQTAARFQRS